MSILKTDKRKLLLFPVLIFLWILVRLGDSGIYVILKIVDSIKKFYLFSRDKISKIKLPARKPVPEPTNVPVKEVVLHTKGRKTRKTKFSKIFRIFPVIFSKKVRVSFLVLFLGVSFVVYSYFLVAIAHDLPSPISLRSLPTPTTTEFYDRNGVLLYRFYEGKNHKPVKLSEIPLPMIEATIAMEDKNFYSHFGVDFYGIARALFSLVKSGEVQGGSTLTQQLIKNTLLTPERTLERKAKEIILAFWTERIFSKDEILEMYFNEAPYGGATVGIAAASQTYFDKNVKDLSLAEATYLAGLPASPTTYSPYGTNPELAKLRQKEVLRRMVEDGFISKERADETFNEEIKIQEPVTEIKAPHFVLYVRSKLAEKYGERFVAQGGLRVYTTLDLKLQEMTEQILAEEVEKIKNLSVSNGAAMITDPKTGQILAMAGSKNYWDPNGGNFNVTTALRQPGSSIKPITYATAFKQGYSPGTTLLDTPVTFKNLWESYSPVNYDGKFHGAVTVRTALASSFNIPAVKMLSIVGIPEMLKTAHDLGITTLTDTNRYGLSLTLGGGEVKMIDMMSVYGTFSQMGRKNDIAEIVKITNSKGDLIEDYRNSQPQVVLQPGIAYLITDILTDNKARTPAFGNNSLLNIPGQTVAVKTGTTDNKRDNWTFGYTPEYVVGVWVGNNDNAPMNPQLTSGITGASSIWNKIMVELLRNKPQIAFEKPADIIQGTVDGHKDLVVSGIPTKSVVGKIRQKQEEKKEDNKDVITFTDPFTTYQSDQSGQTVIVNP